MGSFQNDQAALRWFAHRSDPSALLCSRYAPQAWVRLRPALSELFDLQREHHFLRTQPSFLDRLMERQITTAMRNVLEREPERRLERCQAMFEACGVGPDDPLARVLDIEADDSARRLDLAVHAVTASGRRRCLVIEAKFGAPLQPAQLQRYRRLVAKDYPAEEQRVLRVVASKPPASFGGRHRQGEWLFVHWSAFLRGWQRASPDREAKNLLELMAQIWRQG